MAQANGELALVEQQNRTLAQLATEGVTLPPTADAVVTPAPFARTGVRDPTGSKTRAVLRRRTYLRRLTSKERRRSATITALRRDEQQPLDSDAKARAKAWQHARQSAVCDVVKPWARAPSTRDPLADGGRRLTSVDEVVVVPEHNYVAAIGGYIHNYQHYVATRQGRTIDYVVAGGGGRVHARDSPHRPAPPGALHGASEETFRCFHSGVTRSRRMAA